jgi:hypothetical protein
MKTIVLSHELVSKVLMYCEHVKQIELAFRAINLSIDEACTINIRNMFKNMYNVRESITGVNNIHCSNDHDANIKLRYIHSVLPIFSMEDTDAIDYILTEDNK